MSPENFICEPGRYQHQTRWIRKGLDFQRAAWDKQVDVQRGGTFFTVRQDIPPKKRNPPKFIRDVLTTRGDTDDTTSDVDHEGGGGGVLIQRRERESNWIVFL